MKEEEYMTFKAIVAGDVFPIKIRREEEEDAKALIKEVNDKLNFFRSQYKNRKMTDWLTMSMLSYAFENMNLQKGVVSESVQNNLDLLEKKISRLVD